MKKTKEQTAVEWLYDELFSKHEFLSDEQITLLIIFAKAIEKEKQQIIEAHKAGFNDVYDGILCDKRTAEEYYDEMYDVKINQHEKTNNNGVVH